MPSYAASNLSGFDHHAVEPCFVARPESADELGDLCRTSAHDFIPRGAGRGLADGALNRDGGVVLLERLDRLLSFDAETGVLECEGGCSLGKVIETFLRRGWFPIVTPGTRHVTVGGAVAADVHGKNHHRDGSFASCLVDFHLALPSGDVLRCARDENPDVFWATVGGMGLTGTIVTARLQLRRVESAFVTVEYEQTPHLEQTLALFAESDARHCYSVAWIDCLASGASLGRSVVIRGDHTPAADVPEARRERPLETRAGRSWSVPFNLPQFALNPWTVKAFNSRFYARHRTGIRVERYDRFFYPLDAITNYFRLYGRRGFMQYQAVFPRETSRAALPQMLRKLSDTRSASFLAVLKSTGPGNEGMLSFPMAGHTLALDMPYTPGAVEVAKELDRIVLAHDGRVYLAKNAFLTPDALRRMYPRLPEFLAVKGRLDPGWRVRSSLARRLGLVGGA